MTEAQINALVAWCNLHGSKSAERLSAAWRTERYGSFKDSHLLQQVRNRHAREGMALVKETI